MLDLVRKIGAMLMGAQSLNTQQVSSPRWVLGAKPRAPAAPLGSAWSRSQAQECPV